ncbi:MAG: DUF4160 domain-containing protein [Gemmatimonadaceae bacterium]
MLRSSPYRFFFYSDDRNEPPHVHVRREWREGKLWLAPVSVARGGDFRSTELRAIIKLVLEHQPMLLRSWHEYFES